MSKAKTIRRLGVGAIGVIAFWGLLVLGKKPAPDPGAVDLVAVEISGALVSSTTTPATSVSGKAEEEVITNSGGKREFNSTTNIVFHDGDGSGTWEEIVTPCINAGLFPNDFDAIVQESGVWRVRPVGGQVYFESDWIEVAGGGQFILTLWGDEPSRNFPSTHSLTNWSLISQLGGKPKVGCLGDSRVSRQDGVFDPPLQLTLTVVTP